MVNPYIAMGACLSLILPLLVSTETCTLAGTPGLPGMPGMPGWIGREGEKGDKGEAGVAVRPGQGPVRGGKGEPGVQGPTGKRGRVGERGAQGGPGLMGPPGEKGFSGEVVEISAFSVARGTTAAPESFQVVRFTSVITNVNNDYNTETGRFRCRIPGTYYFVYHASSEENLCLQLKRDETTMASFCDLFGNDQRQVSSGGLAMHLKKDQEVWLMTNDNNGMTGKPEGNSVFSGFLVYAH